MSMFLSTQFFDFVGEARLVVSAKATQRCGARRFGIQKARLLPVRRRLVVRGGRRGVFLHVHTPLPAADEIRILKLDWGTAAVAETVDLAREAAVVVGDETFENGDAICQPVDLLLHLADDGLIFARSAGRHLGSLVLPVLDEPDDGDDHHEGCSDCNDAFHLQPRSCERQRRTPVDAEVAIGRASTRGDVESKTSFAAAEHQRHFTGVEMDGA